MIRQGRILTFILAIGISLTWSSALSQNMDIYLVIGQSNMAGRAAIPENLSQPLEGIFLFTGDMSDLWVPTSNPLNIHSSIRKEASMQRLGPAYAFAVKTKENHPEKLLGLVVNARGGSAINEWLPGSHFFNEIIGRAKQARLFGSIAGVIWHQGESDVNRTDEYMGDLKQLIEGLRKELDLPQLPFVAGQLSADTEERRAFNQMLLALPEQVPYTQVALSDDTETFDGTHFDTASQLLMGERYAESMDILIYK
jgi:hypothetical protein